MKFLYNFRTANEKLKTWENIEKKKNSPHPIKISDSYKFENFPR